MEVNFVFRAMLIAIPMLFLGVFASVHFYDRRQRFSGWISLGFFFALSALLVDFNRSNFDPLVVEIFAKLLVWSCNASLVFAIFGRSKSTLPVANIATIISIGGVVQLWFGFIQSDIIIRSIAAALTSGSILACALPTLWKNRRSVLESVMFGLVATVCVTAFARPIIVYGLMEQFHSAATYQNSAYAGIVYATSAAIALSIGITALLMAGHDIIAKQQLAMTIDPLTGLLNRRGVDEIVEHEFTSNDSDNAGRAVMIFDLDLFKQVNDNFGHEAGDKVLRRVSDTIKAIVSKHGRAARIGGEEFVVLLNAKSSEASYAIADQLRDALATTVHPEIGMQNRVTASFGTAILDTGESFAMGLRRADFGLYRAKAEGRNRVVQARRDRIELNSKKVA